MIEITNNHLPSTAVPLVVLFGSKTCWGCGPAQEALQRTEGDLDGDIVAAHADTWANHHLAGELQIRGLPQWIVFDPSGAIIHQAIGMPPGADEMLAILGRLPVARKDS